MGTISPDQVELSRVLIAQPASALYRWPPAFAATRSVPDCAGRVRRDEHQSHQGNPMSTATPAALPRHRPGGLVCVTTRAGTAAGRRSPAATPRWAAGDSVPIGAESDSRDDASARIGASRDGKSSSCPPLQSRPGSQVGAHRVGRESQPCAESPGRCAGTVDPLCGPPVGDEVQQQHPLRRPRETGPSSITQESWSVIRRIAVCWHRDGHTDATIRRVSHRQRPRDDSRIRQVARHDCPSADVMAGLHHVVDKHHFNR